VYYKAAISLWQKFRALYAVEFPEAAFEKWGSRQRGALA
jgi:hypothetical protein